MGNHIAAGNETTTAAPAMANISFPERCGGKVCKDLTLAERNGFCKSDLYPSDAELEAFRTPVVVGTLYEFYCEHYNYPPNYDVFVGCGVVDFIHRTTERMEPSPNSHAQVLKSAHVRAC